ncbi:MAG: bifunctional DNA-formamidopyrimidine glycosylase/DNA-(apurinic or apyrimidinic site) lyase [Betaproteobacteria bacterium]|nr:bifunctional DNA-formamidopyrimidine glycosylase/DNA-(apurinic or apyrimidinic site) lyase [Betaproteobacteria bacterium]
MPELPEVEVLVQELAPHLVGQRIETLRCSGLPLRRFNGNAKALEPLIGQRVRTVTRRAKTIVIGLDRHWLLVHLGMTGNLSWSADRSEADAVAHAFTHAAVQKEGALHRHWQMRLTDGLLAYVDPRRFGDLCLVPHAEGLVGTNSNGVPSDATLGLQGLGPEPLSAGFSGASLHAASRGVRQAIKPWLMNGRAVVGVGNIYASEALFRSGIHPALAAGRLSRPRALHLAETLVEVLKEAIEAGGSTLRDYRHADGSIGGYQSGHLVYGREGQPCPACGRPLRRIIQAQRSTFFCAGCQRR